jgi:hypothetical protein
MRLKKAREMIERDMRKNDLEGWKYKTNRSGTLQAIKRPCVCSHRRKTIIMNKELIEANSERIVKNLARHEIAHARTRWNGHGKEFKKEARKVGVESWAIPKKARDRDKIKAKLPKKYEFY